MRDPTRGQPAVERAVSLGLRAALFWAVLAFAGTEVLSFSLVQLVIFALAFGWLLARLVGRATPVEAPVLLPLVWVGLVLLQRIPLPEFVVEASGRAGSLPGGSVPATLSLAPYETQASLVLWATFLAAFYLSLVVGRTRQGKKQLVFALIFLGILEALYGLAQFLTGWQPLQSYVSEGLHPVGSYVNANHFAGLLEMSLPFVLGMAFHESRALAVAGAKGTSRLRTLLGRDGSERVLVWLFLGVLMFAVVAATQSRLGTLAALGSVFLLMVLVASRPPTRGRAVLLVVFLSAALLLVVWLGALQPLLERFEAVDYQFTSPDRGRWAIWQDTLQLIGRYPWLGVGLGAFPDAYHGVQTAYPAKVVLQGHNDYLQLAAEVGVPGAALVFGSFFYLLGAAVRTFRRAEGSLDQATALGCAGSLAAILIHSLGDFNLQIPANALVFSIVLGLAYATSREARQGRQQPVRRA